MGKSVANAVLDGALNVVVNSADHMNVCTQEPTSFAEAETTYRISTTPMSDGSYGVGDGDTDGRKCSVHQVADIDVLSTGNANHIALVNSNDAALLYVTTCTSQDLTEGNTVTINSWDIEIADPS